MAKPPAQRNKPAISQASKRRAQQNRRLTPLVPVTPTEIDAGNFDPSIDLPGSPGTPPGPPPSRPRKFANLGPKAKRNFISKLRTYNKQVSTYNQQVSTYNRVLTDIAQSSEGIEGYSGPE